jgi:lipase
MERRNRLRVAAAAPELVDSLAVIELEAYALLRTQDADAYTQIRGVRDRWRARPRGTVVRGLRGVRRLLQRTRLVRSVAAPRRQAFLGAQKARGDLWNVLFDDLLIEGAGHMMPLTHPEPVTRALLTRIER